MTTQEAKDRGLLPAEYKEPVLESYRMVFLDSSEYDGTPNLQFSFVEPPTVNQQIDPRPIPKGGGIMEQIKHANKLPAPVFNKEMLDARIKELTDEADAVVGNLVMIKPRRVGSRGKETDVDLAKLEKMFFDPTAYRPKGEED